ncbi:MBL fold metallo-hydrolase [Stappia sp. GBMRC 2046]|uniref:MBL fold metallo-hydrolase n=1 Tax=Stappia sediminis TaxID=2692190 RepID=A0A7X3LU34_9HYPH|nr:MBL fold metallo-hydrolase [Stappia sediminis]MXN65088.1 MBL fold metallo-hydrolase [Stappia sediminis]
MAELSFFGAAGTVTGSCSQVQTGNCRFLIDCGMFQGNRSVRELNAKPFPFEAASLDFVILTHAHIDHTGLVPKLIHHGFRGPIYATAATRDLLEFMLPDSASIVESEAERISRRKQRRNASPIQPIYRMEDAEQALKQIEPCDFEAWFEPAPGVSARFWNAGHILGSASVELKILEDGDEHTLRLLFSGDIGPDEKAFYPEPEAGEGFDYVICESTYGDRDREDYTLEKRREALRKELVEGLERGGNVVIPSFAVERSQELLHDIGVLLKQKEIPPTAVFLDSPLANKVTEVFIRYAHTFDDIDIDEAELFRDPRFRLVKSVEESKAINRVTGGAIIISASGMCEAGRIKHHLKNNIWRKEATILFVGYQAPGTLGQIILSGRKDVRIHGREYKVRATIRQIGNYSAHADRSELVDWIMERSPIVGGLFLNHGEQEARMNLRLLLGEKGLELEKILLPMFDETFELVAGTAQSKGRAAQRIDDAALAHDWHNQYAEFSLALSNRLEGMEDPHEREALLKELQEALGG